MGSGKSLIVVIFLLNIFVVNFSIAQTKHAFQFDVNVTDRMKDINVIVKKNIDNFYLNLEDTSQIFNLFELVNGNKISVPSQISLGTSNFIYWRMDSSTSSGNVRSFYLEKVDKKTVETERKVQFTDNGKELLFSVDGSPVFNYRYATMPVPDNVDQIYTRSGFVHPLKTPSGNIVSRIQPPDHYHHYGLWNPWTHTEYRGEEIDFWNLNKGQGTVRFSDIINIAHGDLFGELTVSHDHIIHPGRGEQVVLKEEINYKLWAADPQGEYWILDVVSKYNCTTKYPLTIKEYRYQGFSLRGPEHWHDSNVKVLTSDGKDKSTGNATRAQWIQVTGPGNERGESGVVMMTHPSNFNHPELLRIWPTGANNGKENVFINFNPAQDRDWVMKPGNTYTMKYRTIISDRKFSDSELDQLLDNFVSSPEVIQSHP